MINKHLFPDLFHFGGFGFFFFLKECMDTPEKFVFDKMSAIITALAFNTVHCTWYTPCVGLFRVHTRVCPFSYYPGLSEIVCPVHPLDD